MQVPIKIPARIANKLKSDDLPDLMEMTTAAGIR